MFSILSSHHALCAAPSKQYILTKAAALDESHKTMPYKYTNEIYNTSSNLSKRSRAQFN